MKLKLWKILQEFSSQTTIHGVPFFGAPKLHVLERIFWVVIVNLAAAGAIALSLSNWRRYSANPTVVSLRKDFRNWNNVFPSATACFLERVNKQYANNYIFDKWRVAQNEEKYEYYMDFVRAVANVSFETLEMLKKFENDDSLKDIDLVELIAKVHPPLSGTLVTSDSTRKVHWQLVLTEIGVCFSVNSKLTNIFAYEVAGVNTTLLRTDDNYLLKCHYLNGLCYARYDSDPLAPLKFYIHSYLDVAHATMDNPLVVKESEELEINYRMQETTSAIALRKLTPSQRKCRFEDEPLTKALPIYSTSTCYILCRYRVIMKLCKCRPFFYHKLGGKVCDISGMLCVAKYAKNITKAPKEIGCECPSLCNTVTYLPQTPKFTKWEYGYFDRRITFRWGLLPPTTKYHRDVLFGFEDLVVSFGGTLALFLGVSFISAIETVFLCFESTWKYCFRKRHTK